MPGVFQRRQAGTAMRHLVLVGRVRLCGAYVHPCPAPGETRYTVTRLRGAPKRASFVIALLGLCAAGLFAGCGGGSDTTTLHVIEHAETDTVRHIGPKNEEDSIGDVLAFANPVFDENNKEQVGSDNGSCIRTAVGKAWE